MSCHEAKTCARCKAAFECKAGNITQCQCFGISFTEEEKEYIAAAYSECICRSCLQAMKREARDKPAKDKMNAILSIFKVK